jgi:hypothetical protein
LNFILFFAIIGSLFLMFGRAAMIAGMYGTIEKDQANKINSRRASVGRSGLQHIECLNSIAEQHAIEMKNAKQIYHTDTGTFSSRVDNACKGRWSVLGENVGVGGDSATIFTAFINSAAHRANIDDSRFTKMGIGAYWDGTQLWITQIFANCSSCTQGWKTNATVAVDPVSPITISGRVYNLDNASGYGGIGIETCTGATVSTASDGKFSFTVSQNNTFCVRVKSSPSGAAGPYLRPEVTGYRSCPAYGSNGTTGYCTSEGTTYEAQVAGAACYNNPTNCGAGKIGGSDTVLSYDRNTDAGYVFVFKGSTTAFSCPNVPNMKPAVILDLLARPANPPDSGIVQTVYTTSEKRDYYYSSAGTRFTAAFYNHSISSISPNAPVVSGSHTHPSGLHQVQLDYTALLQANPSQSYEPRINYSNIWNFNQSLWVRRYSRTSGALLYPPAESNGDGAGGTVTDALTRLVQNSSYGSKLAPRLGPCN